jgi:hypothetical protein
MRTEPIVGRTLLGVALAAGLGGGRVAALEKAAALVDAKGTIVADFAGLSWVPATIAPPGHRFSGAVSDSGDPVTTATLGWKMGELHVQLANLINIPAGGYRDGQLANPSFHRWADDLSLAATWRDDRQGWDVSGRTGLTFNETNPATNYRTGTELHAEAAVEKTLSKAWSLGVQGYYFQQLTSDSGSGALLGPFKEIEAGIGITGAYHFAIGRMPATLRGRVTQDIEAENRLKGAGVWLDFSVPLQLKTPAAAAD